MFTAQGFTWYGPACRGFAFRSAGFGAVTLRGDGVNDGGIKVPPQMLSYVAFSPLIAVAKVADAPTAFAFTSFLAFTRAIALQEDSSMTSETDAREARSSEILLASRISEAL